MFPQFVMEWWSTVSEWAKPVILGALIVVGTGIVAWSLNKAIPAMIRRMYKKVLRDLTDAKRELLLELMKKGKGTSLIIPDDEVIERSGHWRWLVRRARQWEEDRKRFGD